MGLLQINPDHKDWALGGPTSRHHAFMVTPAEEMTCTTCKCTTAGIVKTFNLQPPQSEEPLSSSLLNK
jgi:hypothetical protein